MISAFFCRERSIFVRGNDVPKCTLVGVRDITAIDPDTPDANRDCNKYLQFDVENDRH